MRDCRGRTLTTVKQFLEGDLKNFFVISISVWEVAYGLAGEGVKHKILFCIDGKNYRLPLGEDSPAGITSLSTVAFEATPKQLS